MEARAHPRTTHSISVGLYCPEKDRFQNGKVRDISTEGLFVTGTPCARTGMNFNVVINPSDPDHSITLSARVVRQTMDGFALHFTDIDKRKQEQLEQIIRPRWDGKNVFEGLLIVAAHEKTDNFGGWLRLTSLLFNCRRRCRYDSKHRFA